MTDQNPLQLATQMLGLTNQLIDSLRGLPKPPPWRNIIGELATNPGPYSNVYLNRSGGWWQRSMDEITGMTFHHTLSDSPHATAAHYVNYGGGRPTTPYSIWITQTGEILLCVPLTSGLWHDHTGHRNTNLSIGLAGKLHIYQPADVQLYAAAKLVKWLLHSPDFPRLTSTAQIKGHMDVGTCKNRTECPGWMTIDAERGVQLEDRWKNRFQRIIAKVFDAN